MWTLLMGTEKDRAKLHLLRVWWFSLYLIVATKLHASLLLSFVILPAQNN